MNNMKNLNKYTKINNALLQSKSIIDEHLHIINNFSNLLKEKESIYGFQNELNVLTNNIDSQLATLLVIEHIQDRKIQMLETYSKVQNSMID